MSDREHMLGRIRRALGHPNAASAPSDLSSWPELGQILPSIASEDLLSHFEVELRKIGGSTHVVRDRSEISELLGRLVNDKESHGVVLSRNPLLSALGLADILSELKLPAWMAPSPGALAAGPEAAREFRNRCFSAVAGITGVDFALAETGSLVLSSQTEGSQLSSLAPPIHVALFLRSQIVANLEQILEAIPNEPTPMPGRSIVFVTGTSRTADIEQILIRGVHGPGEVHAVVVEESCLGD